MTLDNLITLITAGFTKDEILTMAGTAPQRAPQPQPQPQIPSQFYPQDSVAYQSRQNYMQAYAQQNPQGYAQQNPQGYAQQARQISEQNDVLSALKSLTSAVQSNNVNLMQNAVPKQVTTEDAIASIINPPNYEGLQGGDN